jgi:hypothetical protein
MSGACSRNELAKTFIFSLVRKHELKRALGKPNYVWKLIIKINLKAMGCEVVD